VIRLLEGEGYGFIAADDGREIYFRRNAVLGDAFGELDIGSRVSFSTETGDKGPQASTVRLLGKRH
jgi:cold shock CspA family protein